jgi:hypothetical protein
MNAGENQTKYETIDFMFFGVFLRGKSTLNSNFSLCFLLKHNFHRLEFVLVRNFICLPTIQTFCVQTLFENFSGNQAGVERDVYVC